MPKLPKEPSGIIVHDGKVCIVGNESSESYFRFELDGLRTSEGAVKLKKLAAIDRVKVDHQRAEDLESIAVLEDQIVVLSEASRRIIGNDKTVLDCSALPSLREDNGGRGLEGMAIRELPDRSSRIAIVWEGGIHKEKKRNAKPTRLLIQTLGEGSLSAKVQLRSESEHRLTNIDLSDSVAGQRFRCPDLVWCWSTTTNDWILLLLLSTREDKAVKYLQAFDVTGRPIVEPVRLKELGMPEEIVEHNWEGLCWHTDDAGEEHLLLVNDTEEPSDMYVCRVRPPANCHHTSE